IGYRLTKKSKSAKYISHHYHQDHYSTIESAGELAAGESPKKILSTKPKVPRTPIPQTTPTDPLGPALKHQPTLLSPITPEVASLIPSTSFVEAKSDRVTVIFSTIFKDPDDVIIGKIFLQEFREGRKASQTAPQIIYSVGEPPLELKNCSEAKIGPNVGYITFGRIHSHGTHTVPEPFD
uniref:Arp2/3 complex 34 kDa subunit n=1 Tax=Meloidogyne javanica TaxID=6303 RepID=A0A915MQ79_MELJA